MSCQSQHQSRRSLSIFSLDHLRSLSRAGMRPAWNSMSHTSSRPPANSSCDPYRQDLVPSESIVTVSNNGAKGLSSSHITENLTDGCSEDGLGHGSQCIERNNVRPRSWFSLSRLSLRKWPARRPSFQFSKGSRSSSVVPSTISTPVLIGTTNIEVAEAEGVFCSGIIDTGLHTDVHLAKEQTSKSILKETDLEETESSKTDPFHLLNLRNERKDKAKSMMSSLRIHSRSVDVNKDTWKFSTVEKRSARRRAETINLCRQKINKLTGSGIIKRKKPDPPHESAAYTGDQSCDGTYNDDIIAQPQLSNPNTGEEQFLSLKHSDTNTAIGSLTRSFASAVDKLDIHTPLSTSSMGIIKSKSSLFSIRSRNKLGSNAKPGIAEPKPSTVASLKTSDGPQENDSQQANAKLTVVEALRQIQPPKQGYRSSVIGSPAEPLQFSGPANGYIPAQPIAEYPKGIKVLGMHSNTMEFATAPSWITDLPKPPTHTPTVEEVTPVEDDEDIIQDAPIYSPSLGDLSQYARPTPISTKPVIESEQHLSLETPTQTQAEKSYRRRFGLRRSQSGLSLLSMFKRGNKQQSEKDGPLQVLADSQKLESAQQLKKSRSMNLIGLLKRSETASLKEPLLRNASDTPTRLVKPSPLRHEARIDELPTVQSLPDLQVRKRTPPRGSITAAERAKRMGVVGIPWGSLDSYAEHDDEMISDASLVRVEQPLTSH